MLFLLHFGDIDQAAWFLVTNPKKCMQSKSSTSTLLIVLLIIFTFPIWLGIAGGIFGLVVGLLGAGFGIIAGVFGAFFGIIGGIFGWLFDWHWPFDRFFHWNFFPIFFIILIVLLISRSRKS